MWERRQEMLCMHRMVREEEWQRRLEKKREEHHIAEVVAEDKRRRRRLWVETKRAVLEYVRVTVMNDKLAQVLLDNPRDGHALAQLAKVQYDTGKFQKSATTYMQGVECGRTGPEVWRMLARARYQLYLQSGKPRDFDRSYKSYQRALRYFDNLIRPDVQLELAGMHISFGSLAGAAQILTHLRTTFPNFKPLKVVHLYSQLLFFRKDYEGCIQYLQQILECLSEDNDSGSDSDEEDLVVAVDEEARNGLFTNTHNGIDAGEWPQLAQSRDQVCRKCRAEVSQPYNTKIVFR